MVPVCDHRPGLVLLGQSGHQSLNRRAASQQQSDTIASPCGPSDAVVAYLAAAYPVRTTWQLCPCPAHFGQRSTANYDILRRKVGTGFWLDSGLSLEVDSLGQSKSAATSGGACSESRSSTIFSIWVPLPPASPLLRDT